MEFPFRFAGLLMVAARVMSHQDSYYTAAVYEHTRIDPSDTLSAEAAVRDNLAYYEKAAEVAGQQGVDIIVFPEYGLFPASSNRSEIRKYLEVVPNPKEVSANPCAEARLFADRPILLALSCMAKANGVVVVANAGGLEFCEDGDQECPDDGELHFNTNLAFDKNGALLSRYYKEHLFFEMSMDVPTEDQDPVFETDFGRFAMFICFDIMYEKMAVTSRLPEVDAILFSTMWFTLLPYLPSTHLFQAWAIGNDATFLASNIQIPGYSLAGSGIFRGRKGSVVHNFNPDGIPKLMVATLPKRNRDISSTSQMTAIFKNGTGPVRADGADVPRVCSYAILGRAEDIYSDFRCSDEVVTNYTLVKLKETEGHVRVCNNHMCCELDYAASNMNESFYIGVYNGSQNFWNSNRYFLEVENCFLARCDDANGTACSHFPTRTETLFHWIFMRATFTTEYVYPSFMTNGLKVVPAADWAFSPKNDASTIEIYSSEGVPVIAATMEGRAYERDPPYVR